MKHLRRPKWLNASNLVATIAILCCAVVVGALLISKQGQIDSQAERLEKQSSQIDQLNGSNQYVTEQYVRAYGQAQANGVEPTTAPPSTLPDADEAPKAASGQDGRGVAFSLCTALGWAVTYTDGKTENAGTCVGDRGQAGKTGKTGAAGKDSTVPGPIGQAGADGADSTVPGPTGAVGPAGGVGPVGPTGAAGSDGADGRPGTDGKDGRGIASVSCVDGPAFRFTFTDGATQDIPGACDAPAPATTPSPAD